MPRNDGTVPCLGNHVFVINILGAILNECFEDAAGLWPQRHFDALTHQSPGVEIDLERTDFYFLYTNSHYVLKFDDFLSPSGGERIIQCANRKKQKKGRGVTFALATN